MTHTDQLSEHQITVLLRSIVGYAVGQWMGMQLSKNGSMPSVAETLPVARAALVLAVRMSQSDKVDVVLADAMEYMRTELLSGDKNVTVTLCASPISALLGAKIMRDNGAVAVRSLLQGDNLAVFLTKVREAFSGFEGQLLEYKKEADQLRVVD